MSQVPFLVSARTAKLIGQENFANANGAIVELVKNAYDADAKNCIIVFGRQAEETCIYIADNGIGMTEDIIKEKWMMIGTDDKLANYESNNGRVKTGAKGIGRFALDRLGFTSKMWTIAKDSPEGAEWQVTWSDFEKPGIPISQVYAELNQLGKFNLKERLIEEFEGYSAIKELIEEANFESGTLLKITPLKDIWDEESIKKLFDNLEVLIPPQEQPTFAVHVFSEQHPNEFGQINSAYYDDFDYKFHVRYMGDESQRIGIEITRNELDIKRLVTSYKEVFDFTLMKEFPYDKETIESKTFCLIKTISELPGFSRGIDKKLIEKIGCFDFTFYFLKNTITGDERQKYPYLNFSSANRKAWLQKFGGVKIFRDEFRVRPYGENSQDWLGLGERQAESPGGPGQKLGGYRIGPNQIAGTIKISRIANASFQDKSGREGIQENEVFELFKNLLIEIIALFERDRNVIMYSLSELQKQRFKDEEEKRKAKEETDRILREQEQAQATQSEEQEQPDFNSDSCTDIGNNTEVEILLAKANRIYEQEIEEKNTEIKVLRSLASLGLIISSFAHEVKGLRSRLIPRTDYLINELRKFISEGQLEKVNVQDNPFYMIKLIKDEDLKLKYWLDYSLSALKKDKRSRVSINIDEYFENFRITWSKSLEQRNVSLVLNSTNTLGNDIRAFEVDLDAIFNNLLSNSLSAFKERKGAYKKTVTISWKRSPTHVEVEFSDNGGGLAKEFMDDPNRIFRFNETSKRDRKGNVIGTGMGLFIVQSVVEDYVDAEIEIIPVDIGFTMKVALPVRK